VVAFTESTHWNWDAITAIGTVVLAVIAGGALWFARQQITDFRKESRIKHLIDLVNDFEREPLAGYRKRLGAKRLVHGKLVPLELNNPPPEMHDVLNFFEHIGYLLDGGYLGLEDVSVEFFYWISHLWLDANGLIKHEQTESVTYYEYLEKMEHRLETLEKKRFGKFVPPSVQELEYFYAEEAKSSSGSAIPRLRRKSSS
jgi:hypothetical protein